jgi:hypothetical protein
VLVLVLHLLLVLNHYVGTLLLSAASFLGTVWSGTAAAGILVRPGNACHSLSARQCCRPQQPAATGKAKAALYRTIINALR